MGRLCRLIPVFTRWLSVVTLSQRMWARALIHPGLGEGSSLPGGNLVLSVVGTSAVLLMLRPALCLEVCSDAVSSRVDRSLGAGQLSFGVWLLFKPLFYLSVLRTEPKVSGLLDKGSPFARISSWFLIILLFLCFGR